jgi:tetratricopeptide (TPR) repeat protein
MRSRRLLQSLAVRWVRDDDPLPVKELLRGYEGKADDERANIMEQLSELPDHQAVAAFCRLARFDTTNVLSKRAALWLMQTSSPSTNPPSSDASVNRLSDTIVKELGPSERDAAKWLHAFAETLKNPAVTVETWQRIVTEEEAAFHTTPEKSSLDITRDLLRWQADFLERLGREEESLKAIARTIDLLDGTYEQVLETVDWLFQRKAWPLVDDVARRFPQRFDESPQLLYRLAAAQVNLGRKEEGEGTARKAFEVTPDGHKEHFLAAFWLEEKGLLEWSERAYRRVIEAVPADSPQGFGLLARLRLSEMLHDQLRDLAAAEVLQGAVDAIDRDENARYVLSAWSRREPGGVRSRLLYFYAEHCRVTGDAKKRAEHLKKAVEHDPTDADVLIAMYRDSVQDPARRKEAVSLIEQAAAVFRQQIEQLERETIDPLNEPDRTESRGKLASENNQLAWLIANTEGDYEEALRCSRRSLELLPDTAGYLDTLGRCYYAKGDYEKAVQFQSRAVELEPHSGQIRRQLELFQQALKGSREK